MKPRVGLRLTEFRLSLDFCNLTFQDQLIWKVCQQSQSTGTYHYSDAGVASWYDFTVNIQSLATKLGLLDKHIPINPISSADYQTLAKRPFYSVLDKTKAYKEFGMNAINWQFGLEEMLKEKL